MMFFTRPDAQTGLAERLRIDSQGLVGISVNAPGSPLQVNPTADTRFNSGFGGMTLHMYGGGPSAPSTYRMYMGVDSVLQLPYIQGKT